jgi:uncharacterized protein (UPF0335 family)
VTEHLSNSMAAKARPFIGQIEDLERDMDSLTGEHMARLKAKRQERKDIYASARDAGVPTRPLKGHVKLRRLQRKIDAIPCDFDMDEARAYKELSEGALGDLGVAAARAAGFSNGGDDADVRPPFMQRREQERADEAALDKVGRGADPVDSIR